MTVTTAGPPARGFAAAPPRTGGSSLPFSPGARTHQSAVIRNPVLHRRLLDFVSCALLGSLCLTRLFDYWPVVDPRVRLQAPVVRLFVDPRVHLQVPVVRLSICRSGFDRTLRSSGRLRTCNFGCFSDSSEFRAPTGSATSVADSDSSEFRAPTGSATSVAYKLHQVYSFGLLGVQGACGQRNFGCIRTLRSSGRLRAAQLRLHSKSSEFQASSDAHLRMPCN